MGFNEPFLVNPPKRHRGRFSFRSMLSKLGNPRRKRRGYKASFTKLLSKSGRKFYRGMKFVRRKRHNPLADLMIMNAPKKRRKINSPVRTGRGENKMARRKRRNAPKKHRITTIGRRVSWHSKRAKKHRGFLLNPPAMLSGLIPSGTMIQDVLGITAGYVAVKLIPKYVFPIVGITEPTGVMGTVSKVAVVIGVGMVAGFLKKPALRHALITGGLVAIAIDLLGQTGVLSDGMGYILPPERLNSYQISASTMGFGEDEDSRR